MHLKVSYCGHFVAGLLGLAHKQRNKHSTDTLFPTPANRKISAYNFFAEKTFSYVAHNQNCFLLLEEIARCICSQVCKFIFYHILTKKHNRNTTEGLAEWIPCRRYEYFSLRKQINPLVAMYSYRQGFRCAEQSELLRVAQNLLKISTESKSCLPPCF